MNKTLGSVLLLIGLSVGAGTLALPISLAQLGFGWSIILLVFFWFFMTYTGLVLLEVNLWFQPGANFITMAHKSIGTWASIIVWVAYLTLFYSIITTYITAGGTIIAAGIKNVTSNYISARYGELPWGLMFAIAVYFGLGKVDIINRILVYGLIVSFALMLSLCIPHANMQNLSGGDLHHIFNVMPIIVVSFGYQIAIPTIRAYMNSDYTRIRNVILWGTLATFLIYATWVTCVFLVVPYYGAHGLSALIHSHTPSTALMQTLNWLTGHTYTALVVRFFIFFALTSSFLTVAYSLFDFFADGLKIKKDHKGKIKLICIVFVPPALFAFIFPSSFLATLSYAAICIAFLQGMLPTMMAFFGRYVKQLSFGTRTFGRGWLLVIAFCVFAFVFYIQIKAWI